MKKNTKNRNDQQFNYGLIAQASVLALAAIATNAHATSCLVATVSGSDLSITDANTCIVQITGASTPGNLTVQGSGTVANGVNTSLTTVSGGGITVQSSGIISSSTGAAVTISPALSSSFFTPTTTALSGSISNAGTISGFSHGIATTFAGTAVVGGIVNTGTISTSTSSTVSGTAGISIGTSSSVTGGISNSGIINSTSSSTTGTGIVVNGFLGGGLSNSVTGSITGNLGVVIKGGSVTGGITNAGTISSSGSAISLSSSGRLTGDINNSGRIESTTNTNAIDVGTGTTITGSIINSGQITKTVASEAGYGLSIAGTVTGSISNSGTITGLIVHPTGSVSGAITNTGRITNAGDGYAVYLGNTSTNDITLNNTGGTIAGSVQMSNRNTLNLNSGQITGSVLGTGTSTLNIAGSLSTVSGNVVTSSSILGPVNLNTGSTSTVNINGSYIALNSIAASQVNINNGGTLYLGSSAGTGTSVATGTTSGALSIASGGVLSVVNPSFVFLGSGSASLNNSGVLSIGQGSALTITGGGYTQSGGGVLQTGVASMSSYGKLKLTSGAAYMPTGAKIDVVVASGASLTAGGLLASVIGNPFSTSSVTGGAVSSYVVTDNSDAYDFVAEACTSISTIEGSGCFSLNSIGLRITATNGAGLGKTPATRPLVTTGVSGTIFQMLRMGNNVVQAVSSSNSSGGGINTGDVLGDRHGWIKPLVMRSKQNDEGTVSGYKADSYGIIGGMDGNYNDKTRLGVAVSYMTSKVESNRSLATHDADISSWRVIGYGSYAISANTEATFQGDYSTGTIKGRRQIAVGDVASSNYKNSTLHFSGAVSRVIEMTPGKTTFTPTLRVDYTYSRDGGYTETGGSTNLVVQSNISKEMIVAAQGKVNHAISSNTTLSVNASVGYDVIGQQSSLTAAALGGGASFVATGLAPQREVYQLGVGSLTKLAAGGEINLRYDLETRRGFTGQSVSVKYRKPF